MKSIEKIFTGNREWSAEISKSDPAFFDTISKGQSPDILWIGCSDSRVPPDTITGSSPGTIFVHRNIANMAVHTDFSFLSVLQYAIDVLKVGHVVVCGHYSCGGVTAAVKGEPHGLIDNWLLHINDVYLKYKDELMKIEEIPHRADRLSELNVLEQVSNVSITPTIQGAWQRGQKVTIHGFVFDLSSGLLKDLNIGITSSQDIGHISL
ncbi:carbonate dehydratase [Thermodesulfobacteriota bacterium]